MNKIISTKDRVFMSLVGPSGSGKTQLIYQWLTIGTFQPQFDKIFYFFQHQPIYDSMKKSVEHIQFLEGADFEFINSLKNDGTKYLLIFDDSFDEICSSKAFVKVATAGRAKGCRCHAAG